MRFPATIERGAVRPFVPIELAFQCPGCGTVDTAFGAGMVDTGAPSSVMPEVCLPGDGHVTWDDLTDEAPTVRTIHGQREARWWDTTVAVAGIPFATRIKVYKGELPDFPVLGLNDFGRTFRITLDFGVEPPTFDIEPYGLARPDPVRLQDFPVVDYGHSQVRLGQDLLRFTRQAPSLPAGEAHRLLNGPQRPSRAVRRAHARRRGTLSP